jgi:hypothetical protein
MVEGSGNGASLFAGFCWGSQEDFFAGYQGIHGKDGSVDGNYSVG